MPQFRFSIRTLLIVVAVAGLLAAYAGVQIRRRYIHRALIDSLIADGCQVIGSVDSSGLLVANCALSQRTLDLVERYDLHFSTTGVPNGVLAQEVMRGLHQYRHSSDSAERAVQAAVDELRKAFPYEQMILESDRHGCRLNASGGKLTAEGATLLSRASRVYAVSTFQMQFEPGAEEILLQSFRKNQEPGASFISYRRL
ncbi:MAG: hypothetical protein U0836_13630 [Pirellulales bacterium]